MTLGSHSGSVEEAHCPRPRIPHDLRCPHCGSNWTPKDGRSRGKQTYRCRDCHYRFTPEGKRSYFSGERKRQALDMYAEGTGITAVGWVLGVKPATVFSWVKKSPSGQGTDGANDAVAGGAAAGDAVSPGNLLR